MRGSWPDQQLLDTYDANCGTESGVWQKHPTAEVSVLALVWPDVIVWAWSHVRENAQLRRGVSIAERCYVAEGVEIGEQSRIGNGVSIWRGVSIGKRVFVSPGVVFTNDKTPRVGNKDFTPIPTYVDDEVGIGAGAVIVAGITIGRGAIIGAGAIVTRDVHPGEIWAGMPARMIERSRV